MEFRKYQHIERFGTDEVNGINQGECYIFPKIDGTNGSVWMEDSEICAGSRNRKLSYDEDNAGFYKEIIEDEGIERLLIMCPSYRLFGEWLVPHALKTYRDDAWREFYVFDVTCEDEDGTMRYLHYEEYKPLLDSFGIKYIPPICKITDPNYQDLINLLDKNTFLIKDGEGSGEGIVIKNYNYKNKYGRKTWAKIVSNEFKENHGRNTKTKELISKDSIEQKIVDKYCTEALIEKEYAKIVLESGCWSSKFIKMLLSRVYHAVITEESWNIVKTFKNPIVDFKLLNGLVVNKVKMVKNELF
jgi:hypothetical protein